MAVAEVKTWADREHHVVAIDQGLIVTNPKGMRPVERNLAKALGYMHCGAYPSNTANISCYGPGAGIWRFQAALRHQGYVHSPMAIPHSDCGRFYFECYPHPALIALLNLSRILKYKCRHGSQDDWARLFSAIRSWQVDGIEPVLESLTPQTKANEDAIDSIICAYVGLLWWQWGVDRSSMIGDLNSGYIITPHNPITLPLFARQFGQSVNVFGTVSEPPRTPPLSSMDRSSLSEALAGQPTDQIRCDANIACTASIPEWSGPVNLVATDTTILWRNANGQVVNDWLRLDRFEGWKLTVKFMDQDGEPEVDFVQFKNGGPSQKGMRADTEGQPDLWYLLVAGASKDEFLSLPVLYRYEQIVSSL